MEQHGNPIEALRQRATQHLHQILSRTPGKSSQAAASEAEAIVSLAFTDGNPVRELFVSATPTRERERPRSPSPTGTIRPKSSKGFFKFARGSRDKAVAADHKAGSSSKPKTANIDGVSPLFHQIYGPVEEKKPKRKERVGDAAPPASSAGPSRGVPVANFCSPQKTARVFEQYTCIMCLKELSSKGVYKRHLEDQHIKPTLFECENCHAYFDAKPAAKKHSSQCGEADLSWTQTKLQKKVYACEYTGSYFVSLDRFSQHLITLSEQPENTRPRPSLNTKLDAIIRYAARHNETLLPTCCAVSEELFGLPDAWHDLQWDDHYLSTKIADLEHATFNEDGTIESTRWTGSSPKRRNTRSYLMQLFQAGRLRSNSTPLANIKGEAMSMCSTPMPFLHMGQSAASSTGSTDTLQRVASPVSRSRGRQPTWTQDSIEQSTAATTPCSIPTGDDVIPAELKSKRHLSDESRLYMPARTPPGPPDPPDYQYQMDPSESDQAPQLPPLPSWTPCGSTMSLPLRKQEGNRHEFGMTSAPYQQPLYHIDPGDSSRTLVSDAASETSTLAQSYREPEFSTMDYNLWAQQQLAFQGHPAYPYGNFDYSMPDDASTVASSIATGNTIVDYVTEIPKIDNYPEMNLAGHGHTGTFYLHDEENGRGDTLA